MTATYLANVNLLLNAPILEVNFLFVPGNSGGPIFDAETSQVVGFVDAFTTIKIGEGRTRNSNIESANGN